MITSNEVKTALDQHFGNIGAVTALDPDPAFPNDPPRFEVAITGGKLGPGFLKAVELKTGYQAEFVLKRGEPREDVIHLAVPTTPAIVEPPLDTQDTQRWPRAVIDAANAEASVNVPDAPKADDPLPDFDTPIAPRTAPTTADPRDLEIDDLRTCVRLLNDLYRQHEDDQETLKSYRLVNQAQSEMLRETIVEAKPPRVEIKTLMHQPAYADADRELATALSEGWQMLHAAVYVNPADEMTWRTVTLIRETAASAQPQPEKAVAERDPLLQGGARHAVIPPMRKPNIDRPRVPSYARAFAEQNPFTAAIVSGSVPAWKAEQNQAQLDRAKAEFRASLADVPDFKPLPMALKAGEPS